MQSPQARDENGEAYIPSSQRPDGTWRKARRVKEGYVPQEEVPLYESKGKHFVNRIANTEVVLPSGVKAHQPIPGLFITEEKEKSKSKKKSKVVNEITNALNQVKLKESPSKAKSTPGKIITTGNDSTKTTDPAQRLKNLKRRLREVQQLEVKLKEGAITKPEPEQLAKLQRKNDLLVQISELEKIACS